MERTRKDFRNGNHRRCRKSWYGKFLNSQIEYIENKYDAEIHRLNSPVLEISSNDIRRRVRDGESIRYLLPDKVEHYIYGHNLYQIGHQKKKKRRMKDMMPIQKIKEDLKKKLSSKRYEHTIGVEYTSTCLAMRYGVDIEKAWLSRAAP